MEKTPNHWQKQPQSFVQTDNRDLGRTFTPGQDNPLGDSTEQQHLTDPEAKRENCAQHPITLGPGSPLCGGLMALRCNNYFWDWDGGSSLKGWPKHKLIARSVFQHKDTHGRLQDNRVMESIKIKVLKEWEGRGKQNCPKRAQVPQASTVPRATGRAGQ